MVEYLSKMYEILVVTVWGISRHSMRY